MAYLKKLDSVKNVLFQIKDQHLLLNLKILMEKNKSGILISEDGICDACKYNKNKSEINWKKREEELFKFLEKYRKNNGEFDCIVPSSGGKDSSFTAHILKTKYKMNPLAVTWAPNMWTEVGLKILTIYQESGE